MRLQCSVVLLNRSCGSNSRGKPVKSTIALGHEPNEPLSHFLIHFSSANKCGSKYKIAGNIERVFCKFCSEGKATIQFKKPPHDLLLQSDPLTLNEFLKTLKNCLEGKPALNPCSLGVTAPAPDPTKMVVLDLSEYPVKGFPRTLLRLQISGIGMRVFKRDILSLRHLRVLDLRDNNLERLPREIGDMPNLAELHLANNKLDLAAGRGWNWTDGKAAATRLKLLDLSFNGLRYLPGSICKLKSLLTLNVDNNALKRLPGGVGTLKKLRYLCAANNLMPSLPASILSLRLQQADLSSNPLQYEECSGVNNVRFKISSLVDIAATAVLRNKIHYASDIIPHTLVDYLNDAVYCVCGAPTFNFENHMKYFYSLKSFCETIICNGKYYATFDCYLCSYKCYRKYISRKRSRES